MSFEYSIKTFESFIYFNPALSLLLIGNWYLASYESLAYKQVSSISGSWFIRLSNGFVFPDPESPTISIMYGWWGISDQFGLCSFISSFVI